MKEWDSLLSAADEGTRLDVLRTLRSKVAVALDKTSSGRDIASLSKRLCEICAEIDDLEHASKQQDMAESEKPTNVLELVRARHERRAE